MAGGRGLDHEPVRALTVKYVRFAVLGDLRSATEIKLRKLIKLIKHTLRERAQRASLHPSDLHF